MLVAQIKKYGGERRTCTPCRQSGTLGFQDRSSAGLVHSPFHEMAEHRGLAPHAATRGTVGLANHANALVWFVLLIRLVFPAGLAPAASVFAERRSIF